MVVRPTPAVVWIFAAAVGIAATLSRPGVAQEATGGRLLSYEETRLCVCREDAIADLKATLDASSPLDVEYHRVDDLVTRGRSSVDTNDQAEVDSFRRLYARREALRQQLAAKRGPLLAQLARLVADYNAGCANQRMLKINVDAVRADPAQCPRLP